MKALELSRASSLTLTSMVESECHVGVHARAEVLDGCGVVEGLALLVRTMVGMVEAVQLLQLILHGIGVLEELAREDISMT